MNKFCQIIFNPSAILYIEEISVVVLKIKNIDTIKHLTILDKLIKFVTNFISSINILK